MRRLRLAALFVVALAVPALAAAGTTLHTVETTQPVVFAGTNPCNGEPVEIEGHAHAVFDVTIGTDGKIHAVAMAFEFQGTGLNIVTGSKYRVVKRNFQQSNLDPARDEFTFDERMAVTRLGEDGLPIADDFYMRLQAHVTISASGRIGANFVRPTFECN